MKCRKCGSGNMGVMPNKKNPSATDLYCLDCGAWQKFATKDEIRLYQCKKGPITNADRIRAMSDHDLAVFLEHAMYDSSEPDWMTVLSWLQQPAEEETWWRLKS